MAKAKAPSTKKSSSSKKAKEPIVEIDGVGAKEAVNFEAPEPPAVAEPAANVIWSSERIYKQVTKDGEKEIVAWVSSPTDTDKMGKLKHGNPPPFLKIGADLLELPSAENQLKGFYHKDAFRLVRQVNGFKFLKPKG